MSKNKKHKVVGVIPARLGSERLARKVLREIHGKLLVEQVYQGVAASRRLDEVWVATDAKEVRQACRERKIPVLMTSPDHPSGTDRIYEVMTQKPAGIYVNIQGDEPLVRPEHMEMLLEPFDSNDPVRVSTLKIKISRETAQNPNVVKVVTSAAGWALYFSRSPIPFDRDNTGSQPPFKHLGFYAYTAEALKTFHDLPPSRLEQTERLEQLRFLENGVPIFVAETTFDSVGVDTEEDLKRASGLLKRPA